MGAACCGTTPVARLADHRKITLLEQQIRDLQLQLEERDSELAVRAANRELMTQLNC